MPFRVLIADDLKFVRDAVREILENAGFLVAGEAENGYEAVRIYLKERPDIVILDITMPVMDGLKALEKIKRLDPHAKVIMCSALGQQEYIIRSIQLGARDFIVKPFKPERIVSAVTRACA
ncbi:MAG: two-component system response regulator [Spirochaetes bacterium]|mgnify:CR=1 FL=1|nr:MAG: two-component system response regulator [Spirochaetota bacterium]